MNITKFYNHSRIKNESRKGMAIVNATPKGNEVQRYNVGDVVQSTESSVYKFNRGVIVEVYTVNGYYYYVLDVKGFTRTARTNDIRRAKK